MELFKRAIYNLFKKDFERYATEDFFEVIPKKVSEPVMNVVPDFARKLDQMLLYHAFILQRRIARTPKEVDTVFGMLAEIRILRRVLIPAKMQNTRDGDEDLISAKEAKERREEREKLDKSLQGVDKFRKGSVAS